MGTDTAIIVFSVNILTSILKRWIYPRWGKIGVQVLVFILAAIGAIYFTYKHFVPGLQEFVASFIVVISLAITFYELILSYIPFFNNKD